MPTELKLGTIRVLASYSRLTVSIVVGVLLVPVLLHGLGVQAFGILGLLGASVGIAEMVRAIVGESMIRELGAAYHDDDPDEFTRAYSSAVVLNAGAALIVMMLFGGIWLLLPVLNIPPDLLSATAWFLLVKGGLSVFIVLTSAQYNMYRVTERVVLSNLWRTLYRVTDLLVAVLLFLILGIRDPSRGLILFGILSVGTSSVIHLVALLWIFKLEPRLVFSLSVVNRESIRSLLGTAGWNTLVVTALNLHIRLDQFIMNIAFGTVGNAIFTLGVRLTGYVWQIAKAATDGLDAVSARISSAEKHRRGMTEMLFHVTRLQAIITIPVGLIAIVMAEPFMVLWVGRASGAPALIPQAVVIAQILVVGMIAKGISHVWMRLLYGSGHVRNYAPLVLCGGALNPVTAVLLIWLLPSDVSYIGPALAFTSMFIIFHFILLPAVVARCMGVSLFEVLNPLLKPTVATVISGPALFIHHLLGTPQSPIAVLLALAVFGGVWFPLGWWFVLDAEDRRRLSGGIMRKLRQSATRSAPADLSLDNEASRSWEIDDGPVPGDPVPDASTDRARE